MIMFLEPVVNFMFDGGNITHIKRPFWKTLQQVRNIRNKPWGEQRMVYLKGMKEQKQKRAIDRFFQSVLW